MLNIHDLESTKELDHKAMQAVSGGYDYGIKRSGKQLTDAADSGSLKTTTYQKAYLNLLLSIS